MSTTRSKYVALSRAMRYAKENDDIGLVNTLMWLRDEEYKSKVEHISLKPRKRIRRTKACESVHDPEPNPQPPVIAEVVVSEPEIIEGNEVVIELSVMPDEVMREAPTEPLPPQLPEPTCTEIAVVPERVNAMVEATPLPTTTTTTRQDENDLVRVRRIPTKDEINAFMDTMRNAALETHQKNLDAVAERRMTMDEMLRNVASCKTQIVGPGGWQMDRALGTPRKLTTGFNLKKIVFYPTQGNMSAPLPCDHCGMFGVHKWLMQCGETTVSHIRVPLCTICCGKLMIWKLFCIHINHALGMVRNSMAGGYRCAASSYFKEKMTQGFKQAQDVLLITL